MVMRAFSFWQLTVVATKLTSSIIQSALFKLSVPRTKYELDPNLRKSLEEPRTGKLNNGGPISSRPPHAKQVPNRYFIILRNNPIRHLSRSRVFRCRQTARSADRLQDTRARTRM